MVFLSVLVVLLAGAVAALAVGRLGTGMSVAMPEPVHTTGHDVFGPEEVTRAELAAVRFDRALRGYRMDQVDAVLDRLGEELDRRDAQLAHIWAGRIAAIEPTGREAWQAQGPEAPEEHDVPPAPHAPRDGGGDVPGEPDLPEPRGTRS